MSEILKKIHKDYINNTEEKAIVLEKTVFLCRLTKIVIKVLNSDFSNVHVSTVCLKHLYDRKPAEEYDCILNYAHEVIEYPEKIYKNKTGKKGEYILVKTIKNNPYLCSLEKKQDVFELVTSFRVRKKEKYLKSYELLWSREDDIPSIV